MKIKESAFVFAALAGLLLGGCSPMIAGSVHLVDVNNRPVQGESTDDVVVNMINTTAAIEDASYSVPVDAQGRFESEKGMIHKGTYKVEVSKIGYQTESNTVEIGRFTRKKLDISLKKILEGQRRSIGSSHSDEDKIINPGEVNIQMPMM